MANYITFKKPNTFGNFSLLHCGSCNCPTNSLSLFTTMLANLYGCDAERYFFIRVESLPKKNAFIILRVRQNSPFLSKIWYFRGMCIFSFFQPDKSTKWLFLMLCYTAMLKNQNKMGQRKT